ncbi:MAG: acyl-CoA dehydrogenase family protein [Chloroflexi bacterium]|nr:acyl-CoA dehydrogenase family protein [Chloroflexota bacterium]
MDFRFTAEQEHFRQEVRAFLEEQLKAGIFKPQVNAWTHGYGPELARRTATRGWIGLTWPKEYGGGGKGYLERVIFTEEFLRCGAPMDFMIGDRQVGPTLLAFGTEAQKRFFLPRIVRGEIRFCIGMSEPQAGSDLSAVKTRAAADGDSFIINGQKLWTSAAHVSDYVYLLARTNPDTAIPAARTLSDFIVDLKLPGITIVPVVDMTGGHMWNEVFFDSVRVPGSALVGQKDRGFYQHMAILDHERSGMERLMGNYPLLTAISRYVRDTHVAGAPLCQKEWVRHLLADLLVKYEVGKSLIYRVAWLIDQKDDSAAGRIELTRSTCIAKAFGTRYEQALDKAAARILGPGTLLAEGAEWAPLAGMASLAYLYSPAHTTQAGTHEILLNVIATRGLGLPAR